MTTPPSKNSKARATESSKFTQLRPRRKRGSLATTCRALASSSWTFSSFRGKKVMGSSMCSFK
eukprot:5826420-Amphidinium_carterae.1